LDGAGFAMAVAAPPANRTIGAFVAEPAVQPQSRSEASPIEQARPTAEPVEAQVADTGAESQNTDNPPVRLRDFRFFSASESMRERELETRLDRLEQELKAANTRHRFSDSFSVRLDAQLDRARLERDLDVIQSEIGRLRLEQAFSSTAGAGAVAVPAETQSSAPDSASSLNLLA
jgi:hypothetical protein